MASTAVCESVDTPSAAGNRQQALADSRQQALAGSRWQVAGSSGHRRADIGEQVAGISRQQVVPIAAIFPGSFVATRKSFPSALVPVTIVGAPAVAPMASVTVAVPTVAPTPASATVGVPMYSGTSTSTSSCS